MADLPDAAVQLTGDEYMLDFGDGAEELLQAAAQGRTSPDENVKSKGSDEPGPDEEDLEEEDEEEVEEEEEYVILDLDDVFHGQPVPANTYYVLSGLDTMNPILVLNGIKLIGEYVETVGSVLVYSEREETNQETIIHSEEFATPTIVDTEKKLVKKVEGMCTLERRLKFRHVEA